MSHMPFLEESGSFAVNRPENVSYLYFPLASDTGMKSAVTPGLGGDAKLDQETFLLEPVSAENLHDNRASRNFWLRCGGQAWSCTGTSAGQEAQKFTPDQEDSRLQAGLMWQTVERTSGPLGITARVTLFCPLSDNLEVMLVTVRNTGARTLQATPFAAVPLYGRSADNIRDHRNVTSMLHRIHCTAHGVAVQPTMSFDERGHRPNRTLYYVLGAGPGGQQPDGFYPTVESFLGEGGTYLRPRAVVEGRPGVPAGSTAAGREAMGAFRFPDLTLAPGAEAAYVLLLGVARTPEELDRAW